MKSIEEWMEENRQRRKKDRRMRRELDSLLDQRIGVEREPPPYEKYPERAKAMRELRAMGRIPKQTYRTIKGHILSGDLDGARRGMQTIRERTKKG